MDYSVVFSGKVHDGFTVEQVRQNIAALFRTDDATRLDQLFSGSPVVLKKGLDEDRARKYQQTLLKAGAVCELRQAGAAPLPTPAAAPALVLEDPFLPIVAKRPDAPAPAVTEQLAYTSLAGLKLGEMDTPAEPEPPALPAAPTPPAPSRPAFGASLAGLSLVPLDHPEPAARAAAPVPVAAVAVATTASFKIAPPPPPPRPVVVNAVPAPSGSAALVSPILREQLAADTSAVRSLYDSGGGVMPDEAKGLSWAGFFLPWLWLRRHSAWYVAPPLIALRIFHSLIPWPIWALGYLAAIGYLLVKGREMAWNRKAWSSVEAFNKTQRNWAIAGGVLAVFQVALLVSLVVSPGHRRHAENAEAAQASTLTQPQDAGPATDQDDANAAPDQGQQGLSVSREAYLNSFKDPVEREQRRKQLEAAAARDAAQASNGGSQ